MSSPEVDLAKKMRVQAIDILRRITPWLPEANNLVKSEFRLNYKGVHGRIGIIGGARDYAGAPYFASISAMRLGADLATVICSKDASQVIKSYSPDLIVSPILDHPDEEMFDSEMNCLFERLHTLVIGPGLGRDEFIQKRIKGLIEKSKIQAMPLILDADSLILINEDHQIIQGHPMVLLTPNRIELQRLCKSVLGKDLDLRHLSHNEIVSIVQECSRSLKAAILAKGNIDIICDHSISKEELLLQTDPMTGSNRRCGGQGDIMSGLAGTYLHWIKMTNNTSTSDTAQRIENPMAWAAYLAAATTRCANELAYTEFGHGMLASDMINKIPTAFKSLRNKLGDQPEHNQCNYEYAGYFSKEEINRYARQMMMQEFGPTAQLNLKKSSVLIIGAGGLGCPAAVYLGAGGIGRIGIVDDDRVEASNLHRQILHSVEKVGMLKTESMKQALLAINPNVTVVTHSTRMDRSNAVELIKQYDIIVDCTDNLLTRYMINDACVVAKKPLVSGAALKMDGQLTVYNYDKKTPCFRCLFPEPPAPNAVGSCAENGVLGVLPGIIGVQQALEAIKIGAGFEPAYAGKMLLFDGQLGKFRLITLGERKKDCEACGAMSKLNDKLIDYNEFCGTMMCQKDPKPESTLSDDERITVQQYSKILQKRVPHVLIDVRPREASDVSRFKHALQLPVMWMAQNPEEAYNTICENLAKQKTSKIYVVCKRGIASQRGLRVLQDLFRDKDPRVEIQDIMGGMTVWAAQIDPDNYACL